jgi:hypothetical protein
MSIEALKDAILYLDNNKRDYYYYELGEYFTHLNETDSVKNYFTKAIMGGYPAALVQLNYPEIYILLDSNIINKFSWQQRKKIDFEVYEKFIRAGTLDQAVRDGSLYSTNDIFYGSREKKAFIDTLSRRVDSSSYDFVNWVLDKYKYPSELSLGFYPAGFMSLILHITALNNSRSDSLLSKLRNLNSTCDFTQKSVILFLEERQKLYNTAKTCCGLVGGINRYKNIEYINKADSIRLLNNRLRIKEELLEYNSSTDRDEINKKGYDPKPYPPNYFCDNKYKFQ